MSLTQLLAIVGSFRFQMRLARTEAMLSEQNRILHDSKLARQAQQRSEHHDEKVKNNNETQMQNPSDFIEG